MIKFPFLPPRPPLPGELPTVEMEEEEEVEHVEDNLDEEFKRKMKTEGFNEELIEMGIKVARNHLKTPGQAFKIGEEYIRSMSK